MHWENIAPELKGVTKSGKNTTTWIRSLACRRANAAHAFSVGDGFRSIATNLPISAPLTVMKN